MSKVHNDELRQSARAACDRGYLPWGYRLGCAINPASQLESVRVIPTVVPMTEVTGFQGAAKNE